ncbi:hypothetical protein LZ31DRAFT_558764 [Colletotrichum somersetense]|nr:hypothetical protein LZ31DRAFT_558764 [Colletotrichum somersetense]
MRFYCLRRPAACLASSMLPIPASTGLACSFVSHLYSNCHLSVLEVQQQPHPSEKSVSYDRNFV